MNAPREIDPHAAIDFILKHSAAFAQAKAQRVYLEEFRRSKRSLLMAKSDAPAANAREQYAYAHPEYIELLVALQAAVETEEELRWQLIAAQARVDIWRSQEASNRAQDRTTR